MREERYQRVILWLVILFEIIVACLFWWFVIGQIKPIPTSVIDDAHMKVIMFMTGFVMCAVSNNLWRAAAWYTVVWVVAVILGLTGWL